MLFRLRMPVTVQFRFRTPPARARLSRFDRYLVVRITVNSVRDSGFAARERFRDPNSGAVSFGDILVVDSRQWNPVLYEVRGRHQEAIDKNNIIDRIRHDVKTVCTDQQRRFDAGNAPMPTTDSVKFEYLNGLPPTVLAGQFVYPPTFLARKQNKASVMPDGPTAYLGPNSLLETAFRAYLSDLVASKVETGQLSRSTYLLRKSACDYLERYPLSAITRVSDVTPHWLSRFHTWLLSQPSGSPHQKFKNLRMSPGTATSYCSHISKVLTWMKNQYLIPLNPITDMGDLPRQPNKDVVFLNPPQIEKLFQLSVPDSLAVSLWWFRLICLTGLDYPDAVRYAQARYSYEDYTPGGKPKIVIRRAKPPGNVCNIPITERLTDLWDEVIGEAPYAPTDSTLINHLVHIGSMIGFEHRLTPKVGRKTAGVIFLRDYSIKAVSNILGHSTIAITERHYVKVTGYQVDHETDRLR
ncbi:integrase [Spirosoma lacussanchae]|uniref:tyrosine-type recombinase/integrase n=1 Tax=Spirosoma lacussanchae TaxID=1884249 RepID=UPI00110834FE|nr:phage integrase SAM-like domain-containing protein [Spirosoma lacussanchae]